MKISEQQLRDALARGPLTPEEREALRAQVAAHPQERADWEAETALTEALHNLPDVPVASNFNARVLAQLNAPEVRRSRFARPSWLVRPGWSLRLGFAGCLLLAGWLAYHQVDLRQERQMASSLSTVSKVSTVPSPAILRDFEAIRLLSPAPAADAELLAILQ
jgi:anti-sigma factor RsiW